MDGVYPASADLKSALFNFGFFNPFINLKFLNFNYMGIRNKISPRYRYKNPADPQLGVAPNI